MNFYKRVSGIVRSSIFVALVGFLCTVLVSSAYAENPRGDDHSSQVRMTWEEFKELLKIDTDEIVLSWDEFKKLLTLTGSEIKVDYNIQNGKVVLQRDQFKKLLEKMKLPEVTMLKPPGDYLITKAEYSGSMKKKSTTFNVRFHLDVFKKKRDSYPKIRLLPQDAAIREIKLDNVPALVMIENGWYVLTTDKVGQHIIDAQFSIKSDIDKGPDILNLTIPKTAITLLKIDIPIKDVQVAIPQEKYLTISRVGGHTKVDAVLSTTDKINVKMHRILPEDVAKKKGPAKIYAEVMNLLSIEDDVLRVTAKFKLDILQNSIADIKVCVPEGYSILYVRDHNSQEIRDWSTKQEKDREILTIPFGGKKMGAVVFTVVAEKIFAEEENKMEFGGFQVIKAIRETGYVGVEKKSAAEAEIFETDNIDRIDIQRLPIDLVNMSARPIIFALRYLRHPLHLTLKITKHEELQIVNTVIDNASMMSVFLEDGKVITRVVYTLRNTGKQFLETTLPDGAEIWSLYVDGKRELPAKNEQGRFMIPLVPSKVEVGNIVPFDVEIVYYTKTSEFRFMGKERLQFPQTDVIISKMLWSCYLPVDYRFVHFGGNVEKEKIATGLRPFLGMNRVFTYDEVSEYNRALSNWEEPGSAPTDKEVQKMQRLLTSEFRKSVHNEQGGLANQLRQEIGFAENIQRDRVHGAIGAPMLRIDIPASGQLYRFAKTLIEDDEELYVDFHYARGWLSTVFNIFILAVVGFVIYLMRSYIKKSYVIIKEWVATHKDFLNKCKTLQGTRVILGVGVVIFWFLSKFLFVVFVLLFLLAWLKPEWIFRRKEKPDSHA